MDVSKNVNTPTPTFLKLRIHKVRSRESFSSPLANIYQALRKEAVLSTSQSSAYCKF